MLNKIFAALILFFVAFSLWPSAYELFNQNKIQSDRHFELVHNYYTDYNFYLSRIREGLEGNTLVREKYTSEPHNGSLIQIFYLALGWAGRYVNVPWDRPGDVYHVARLVFAVLFLAAVAGFAKKSFLDSSFWQASQRARPESDRSRMLDKTSMTIRVSKNSFSSGSLWAILAFLLAITASSWPILVKVTGGWPAGNVWQSLAGWRFGSFMPWWSITDSLQRITFIPHLLAGQALIIFLLILLGDKNVVSRGGNLIFLGILGLVLGFIFPPGLYFLYAVLGVLFILEIITEKKVTNLNLLPKFVFGLISVPSIIYFLMMIQIYPWKRLVEFDILNPTYFSYIEYFKAMGPVFIFGILGGLLALIKKEKAMFIPLSWVIAWISLLFIFHFIPAQSALRYTEMAAQVPLAILTAYLFYTIINELRIKTNLRINTIIKNSLMIIPLVVIVIGLGVMYSSWLWQKDFIDQKLRAGWPLMAHDNYIMYPLKDFADAMGYLAVNTPRTAVVIGLPETGNYIPVYSGNTVYLGHSNTVKAEEKLPPVKQFFAGQMSGEAAKSWLTGNGIGFIIYGPDEQELGNTPDLKKFYPYLNEIYRNPQFVIYSAE